MNASYLTYIHPTQPPREKIWHLIFIFFLEIFSVSEVFFVLGNKVSDFGSKKPFPLDSLPKCRVWILEFSRWIPLLILNLYTSIIINGESLIWKYCKFFWWKMMELSFLKCTWKLDNYHKQFSVPFRELYQFYSSIFCCDRFKSIGSNWNARICMTSLILVVFPYP